MLQHAARFALRSPVRMFWLVTCAALACPNLVGFSAAARGAVVTARPGAQAVETTYRAEQLRRFVEAASQRRVDVTGIGDSNQLSGGDYGHDHGFQKAWSDQFGMYATGVLPVSPAGSFGVSGVHYNAGHAFSSDQNHPALPAAYKQLGLGSPEAGVAGSGGFVPAGGSATNDAAVYVRSVAPFYDPMSTLAWHSTFHRFPDASGDITPQVRGAGPAYGPNALKTYPTITIPAGSGRVDVVQAIQPSVWAKGAGDWKLSLYDYEASKTGQAGGAAHGKLFSNWQRIENVDRTRGVAYSTLLAQGGKGALHAASTLKDIPDASLAEWMRQETKLQKVGQADAMMLVQIEHGGNDRNYSAPSVGDHPAPSNTGAGFRDNVSAIVARLRQVWGDAGYDTRNLFFAVGPYHVQRDPWTKDKLAEFETGVMQLADETYNLAVVRGTRMLSAQAMYAGGYYREEADDAHLSRTGYEAIGRLAVNQLTGALARDRRGWSDVSSIAFDLDQDGSAFAPQDLVLNNLTSGLTVSPEDISVWYDSTLRELKFTFPGLPGNVLPAGNYRAQLAIEDGSAGPYAYEFMASPVSAPEPSGIAMVLAATVAAATARRRHRRYQH
ncbi:MAG TPA: hypothetical protein VER17_07115 [Tepidisphaeraceae bacterium]|nr:hypothetical protein [Tepidisphaeraceae bacterium]